MNQELIDWSLVNWPWVFLIVMFLIDRKNLLEALLWQPLRGGNGVVQMMELGQYVMVILLVFMTLEERRDGEQYSDAKFASIAAAVTAISGIKHHYKSKSSPEIKEKKEV